MKNKTTELIFVLDRSGSMGGLELETIKGFNSLIEKQKEEEKGECFVTTVLFDNKVEFIHEHINLKKIKKLTKKEYYVRGCTALLDAIGISIAKASENIKDESSKVMMIITTDGLENASKEYSITQVKNLIEDKQKNGWEFLFLGANIDAISTAKSFGIPKTSAATYTANVKGTNINFRAMHYAINQFKDKGKITSDWKTEIVENSKQENQNPSSPKKDLRHSRINIHQEKNR